MDKSTLEARKVELENSFNELQNKKDEIVKQMTQIQGAHTLCVELLDNFKEVPQNDAKPRRAKKSTK